MTQNALDADLLIAGGGLVGPALALAAAQAGLSSILIDAEPRERRAAPEFDGRAYALAAASVRCLQALGLWAPVAAQAQPMTAIEIFDGVPGRRGDRRLRFDGEGDAPFAVLLEDRFLRGALLDAVAAEPLIAERAPARAAAMRVEPGRAALTLEDGTELSGRLVAACDGKRSALARGAGIARAGRAYDQIGLVCAIRCERPHEGVARQIFYPGGPFAILPLPGDRASIVWSERAPVARRIAGLDDRAYAAEIAARMGGLLGRVALEGRRWAYPLALSVARDFVAPRLALVGDAAHAMHPIAGQGFNVALRDVGALAEVLAEAARRGEDVGGALPLERYQRWRRFDSNLFGIFTDGMNRLFSNDLGPLRALRDLGLAAVEAAPALKRAFVAAAAGDAGEPPRLLRGLAL
ncbi:FAD-dependent monooxygenase [Rubrimonas sp.]|uniref:FAD-dependent monooxygenase n=1 Tax=Rubrimonas sp. TaxID=2036015 RepID=UPI002FDE9C48